MEQARCRAHVQAQGSRKVVGAAREAGIRELGQRMWEDLWPAQAAGNGEAPQGGGRRKVRENVFCRLLGVLECVREVEAGEGGRQSLRQLRQPHLTRDTAEAERLRRHGSRGLMGQFEPVCHSPTTQGRQGDALSLPL